MMLREIIELIKYYMKKRHRFAVHDCLNVYRKALRDLRSIGIDGIEGKRVLDLGCGQRFPTALQAAADGADVTALDLNWVRPGSTVSSFLHTYRNNGTKRALKSLFRKVFFDPGYYHALEVVSGKPLRKYSDRVDFVASDPETGVYPLPSKAFDLIMSNAVLEHVVDVPKYASEISRLLRRKGIFYGWIHNFYSLSGGHNLEWAHPEDSPAAKVPPWDHLRENQYPGWVYLNRLRPEQYKEAIASYLEIVLFEGRDINHDPGGFEGEGLLTPEIEKELSAYPRDLLLTRSYCIICRKS